MGHRRGARDDRDRALGLIAYRATRPAQLKPLVRLALDLGADLSRGNLTGAAAILSPDGTRLVYVSKGKLFTRRLDQPNATELTGTDGAFSPFFSPDGLWVGFFAGGKLQKTSVEGGTPVVLCDDSIPIGSGTWAEDGNIIATFLYSPLMRIPAAGGLPVRLMDLAPGETGQLWPQFLPGGKAVLFTSTGSAGHGIEVFSLSDHRRKTLQRGGTYGRYISVSNGAGSNGADYLVYVNNGTLFAVAFDPEKLEVRGAPVPVLDQVVFNSTFGSAQFDVSGATSGTGMLLYQTGGATGGGSVTVQWLDSTGKTQPLLAKPGPYTRPRLSPDGQRLALDIPTGSGWDVWIYEWQRDTMTRLTYEAGERLGASPVWSPDGRYIVFAGKGGIFWTRSDGAGKPQPLQTQVPQSKNSQFPFSVTPDGKRLAWGELMASGGFALWTAPLESGGTGLRAGKPEVFLQNSFDNRQPAFSPDGRWLAYSSDESGTYQVSSGPSRTREASGKSPAPAASSRSGRGMGTSYSSVRKRTGSWWRPTQ